MALVSCVRVESLLDERDSLDGGCDQDAALPLELGVLRRSPGGVRSGSAALEAVHEWAGVAPPGRGAVTAQGLLAAHAVELNLLGAGLAAWAELVGLLPCQHRVAEVLQRSCVQPRMGNVR